MTSVVRYEQQFGKGTCKRGVVTIIDAVRGVQNRRFHQHHCLCGGVDDAMLGVCGVPGGA
ncbi:MAG TPA: hypothetical protein VMS04_05670 [Vicinamibacterales bacterium]|nr:hypothetical protein [Vicinamibacterales bacterium]